MKRYAIVTDSSVNLPKEDHDNPHVYTLPLTITFGDQSFRDQVDITGEELVTWLDQKRPQTSAPLLGDAQALTDDLNAKAYDGILALTMPKALSSTHDVIKASLQQVKAPSRIVDTRTVSIPQGEYVHHALSLFRRGQDLDRVADRLDQKARDGDAVFFAYVHSLDYLVGGGRLSQVQGMVGKALQIKPIVNLDPHGSIQVLAKMRGKKRTIAKMMELMEAFVQGASYRMGFVYGRDPSQSQDLWEAAADLRTHADGTYEDRISSLIMAHSGPDVSAICAYRYDTY